MNSLLKILVTGLSLALATQAVFAQSIVTGDATSISVICNDVNNTTGEAPCTPTPTATPTPTPEPSPTEPPTPTPTPPPSGGGDGGGGQAGGGGGGVGGAAVSVPTPQGEVLGLATTDGEGTETLILYTLASLCLGIGGKLLSAKNLIIG